MGKKMVKCPRCGFLFEYGSKKCPNCHKSNEGIDREEPTDREERNYIKEKLKNNAG